MDMVNTNGQKVVFMKEIGKMDSSMVMDIYWKMDLKWMDFGSMENFFIFKIHLK